MEKKEMEIIISNLFGRITEEQEGQEQRGICSRGRKRQGRDLG